MDPFLCTYAIVQLLSLSFSCNSSTSDTEGGSEDEEEDVDALAESVVTSTVNDEDLPPEISASRPSWLYRRSKTPTPPPGEKPRYVRMYT